MTVPFGNDFTSTAPGHRTSTQSQTSPSRYRLAIIVFCSDLKEGVNGLARPMNDAVVCVQTYLVSLFYI